MNDDSARAWADYGWRPFFASQPDATRADVRPFRVLAVQRTLLHVGNPELETHVPVVTADLDEEDAVTVGDWLVLDANRPRIAARLARFGLFKRRAAGGRRRVQLVAANVDTLLVVTSADRDFNPARLERYLALAREGGAQPVVVVTKADLNPAAPALARDAAMLAPGLVAETVDARDPVAARALAPWCGPGQTVALVGSSGVGKSTLVNTLGAGAQATAAVRARDRRGRHTTSTRSLHRLPSGGWLVDTPGMRELALVDARDGLGSVFVEIDTLAAECRFNDCGHADEPGCAVRAAVDAGRLDDARLERYRKLVSEEARNSLGVAERRAREKSLGKLYRSVQKSRAARRDED